MDPASGLVVVLSSFVCRTGYFAPKQGEWDSQAQARVGQQNSSGLAGWVRIPAVGEDDEREGGAMQGSGDIPVAEFRNAKPAFLRRDSGFAVFEMGHRNVAPPGYSTVSSMPSRARRLLGNLAWQSFSMWRRNSSSCSGSWWVRTRRLTPAISANCMAWS